MSWLAAVIGGSVAVAWVFLILHRARRLHDALDPRKEAERFKRAMKLALILGWLALPSIGWASGYYGTICCAGPITDDPALSVAVPGLPPGVAVALGGLVLAWWARRRR